MLFFIGAIAGFFYGLSALGGSIVAVPLLVLLTAISVPDAMAMNLCMLVVMATITAGDGVRARLPVPGLIWPFALLAASTAPLGVWASASLSSMMWTWLLPAALVLVAVAMVLLSRRLGAMIAWPRGGLAALTPLKIGDNTEDIKLNWKLPLIGGSLGGFFTGLAGLSGALFLVPALGKVFSARPGQAVASAEMAILPALVAAVTASLLFEREIEWRGTGLMIFGALAGLSLARMLAARLSSRGCHIFVAVGLLATGLAAAVDLVPWA